MRKNIKYFILFLVVQLTFCGCNTPIDYTGIYSKASEITEVTIWNIQGGSTDALHEIVQGYNKIYPNVKFIVKDYENQVYKNIIKETLITKEGPDIFFSWGFEFLSDFVEADMLLDITNEFTKLGYDKMIDEEKLTGFTFDNKIYGLPIQGFNAVLYVNEELFNEYEVEMPETYEELIDVIHRFKTNGITPIALGGQESWVLSFVYMTLAIRENGIEEVKKMINNKEYLEGDGFIEAADKFIKLIDKGAFGDNFREQSNNKASYEFCNREAAMLFSGSFSSNNIEEIDPSWKESIKIIPFPITSDKSSLYEGVAGYMDTFVINKHTENKELVVDIYMKLMKDISKKVYENSNGLPVWNEHDINNQDTTVINKCLQVFPSEGYHVPYDTVFTRDLTNIHLSSLEELCSKKITVKEFINRHRGYME